MEAEGCEASFRPGAGRLPGWQRGYVTKGQLQELADSEKSRLPRMLKEGWDLLRVVSRLLNEAH
jgi:hypothetical protein